MSIFGRNNVSKYSPEQLRDEYGRWSTGGGGSVGHETADTVDAAQLALGVRPKHNSGYEFVSPNEGNLNLGGAMAGLTSARQIALLKASQDVDRSLGLDGSDKSVIGAWSDGAENSVMTTVQDSDYSKLKIAAAMKAHLANQKQALVFQQDAAGPAHLYDLNAKGSLESIHQALLSDGVNYHTLVPNEAGDGAKVFVVDTDGSMIGPVTKAAKRFGSVINYTSGHAEFIGTQKEDGSDNDQRNDARRAYEGIINQSSVQGATAKWAGIHNRWGATLQSAALGFKPSGGSGSASGGASGGTRLSTAQAKAQAVAGGHAPLNGLPQKPIELGDGNLYVPGPIGRIRDTADAYMKSAGLPYKPVTEYKKIDNDRAKNIANAYDAMANNPDDPATKASYAALAKEVMAQWQAVKKSGLKIDWIKPGQADPYGKSLRQLNEDVAQNNHMWVFPTTSGFGSDNSVDTTKNPLLKDSGETVNGHRMQVNDVFRIVHDYFGHLKEGNGFRAEGEDNAWRSHAAMFSDAAIPAMTSETRGQNSWVNSGPYAESNKTATPEQTHYAPQKIGLMPDWTWKDKGT